MTRKLVSSALIAGCAAGLLAALLHFALVQDLILEAEAYEAGEATHFAGLAAADPAHDAESAEHAHGGATADPAHDHDHAGDDGGGGEGGVLGRNGLTVAFTALIYVGYGLLLVAGFGVAASLGVRIGLREGLLWGIAGFAAFQLAPAAGLAPELPGTPAAELTARQIWWLGTVVATAGGLALMAYGRGVLAVAAGVVLLALPHVIGAPEAAGYAGVAPPELAATFAARVLAVGLAVWVCLGAVAGWVWDREADA
jgi:cobalt transporter subunit CbtA